MKRRFSFARSNFCLYRSVLQCVAVCCSVLQCVAVCCSVLQCVAVCCSVFLSLALISVAKELSVLWLAQCVVCCSVLQCVAVCCSVLRCVAVCCSVLQREQRALCSLAHSCCYGVATMSRLHKITGLFCRISSNL